MKQLVAFVAMVLIVVIALALYTGWSYSRTADLGATTVSVIIKSGDGFSRIAGRLGDESVIPSTFMLKLFARIRGVDRTLTPGRYDFTGVNSCQAVLDRFQQGKFLRIKVTFPEGAPIWQVASIMADRLEVDSSVVVAFNSDSVLLGQLNLPCLEGYLYPETYFFAWGTDARTAIIEMVEQFRSQTDSLWVPDLPNGMALHDVVTLASIIESETRIDSERTIVSSVYTNRLNQRMKLDADPTVIYGLGGLDRPLYRKDLRKDTPYNTYIHRGLPPTPINSPGLGSIRAAMNPDSTSFLFFVADSNGGHYFSRTNAEHNRAVRRYRNQNK